MAEKPTYAELEAQLQALQTHHTQTCDELEKRQAQIDRQKCISTLLRRMCDNVPDLIWAKDLEGRYLFVNQAICDHVLNAEDTDEPIGKTDLFFAQRESADHPKIPDWQDFGEICTESDRYVLEHKKPAIFEESGNAMGTYLHLEVHKAPFYDGQGRLIGTVGCGRDTTEQKKIETQLRTAQKMEALGTLAGGIAHEFNNILSIILGNTELAIDDTPAWNPTRASLDEIRIASLRAKEVVRQILTYTRKTDQEHIPVRISAVIRESLKLLKSSIPKSIQLNTQIAEDAGTILSDPSQVNQIMMHLINNAVYAMPDGGLIDITLQQIDIDTHTEYSFGEIARGKYAHLKLRDNGHGISPENMDRIFDPYFTTKNMAQGTGMGLAIVHGLVSCNDGAIAAQSIPDRGTTLEIVWPVLKSFTTASILQDTQMPEGNERILLVDDEPALLKMQQQRISRLGYEVVAVSDPDAALALFEAEPRGFDLVISDMSMPKMDGDQLIREILKFRPRLPFILYSGFSDKMDAQRAQTLGISAYLEKPIDRQKLAVAIRRVLDQAKP